jgi:holo-[acyl-carrier protein] synthase
MLYTGIDLIEIPRLQQAVERWGQRFLCRVFTPGELADCGCGTAPLPEHATPPRPNYTSLAARWAAKEAAAKALGVGLRGLSARRNAAGETLRIAWTEVEVARGALGQPLLRLHGTAARVAAAYGMRELAVSLSHTQAYAVANVIGLGDAGTG